MYDEIKVTRDNIVEFSQFKEGDTVTLLKKIKDYEGVYHAGHIMKIDIIEVYPCFNIPKKPLNELKDNYKVNQSMFRLRLIDTDIKNYMWCDANDVIKGEVTGAELEAAIKKRKAEYTFRHIPPIIFALMAIVFLILTIVYGREKIISIACLFLGSFIVCYCILAKLLIFKKCWTKIKKERQTKGEKNERKNNNL